MTTVGLTQNLISLVVVFLLTFSWKQHFFRFAVQLSFESSRILKFSHTGFCARNFQTTVSHSKPKSTRKSFRTCPCHFFEAIDRCLCNEGLLFPKKCPWHCCQVMRKKARQRKSSSNLALKPQVSNLYALHLDEILVWVFRKHERLDRMTLVSEVINGGRRRAVKLSETQHKKCAHLQNARLWKLAASVFVHLKVWRQTKPIDKGIFFVEQ